eukprot:UN4122
MRVKWIGHSSHTVRSAADLFQHMILDTVHCPRRQKEYLVMMDCCTLERCQTLLALHKTNRDGFGVMRVKWIGHSSHTVRSAADLFQHMILDTVHCPRRQKKSLVMMDCCTLERCRTLLALHKTNRDGFGVVRVKWIGHSSHTVRSAADTFQHTMLETLRDGMII